MKSKQELLKMSIKELHEESSLHFDYVRKVDGLIQYKEVWDKK